MSDDEKPITPNRKTVEAMKATRRGEVVTVGTVQGLFDDLHSGPRSITAQIADELHAVLERLGADEEFLSIVGSLGDTLDESEVLRLLREYNAGRPTLRPRQ